MGRGAGSAGRRHGGPQPGAARRPVRGRRVVISPQRRREIVDALRRGTVPQRSLDAFAVGTDRFAAVFDDELATVASGGAGFKAVRGEYGSGKTFVVRWLAERARTQGFASAEVQISERETPLDHLEAVYRRLCERLTTADTTGGALRAVVDSWFFALHEDVVAAGTAPPSDAEAVLAATDALAEQRLGAVAARAPALAAVLRGYRRALADSDNARAEGLLAWLGGQPHVAAPVKRAAGIRGDLDHDAALAFLAGLLTIMRGAGYAGLVLVLDEVETLQRVRSDARDRALNALRQLIDEVDLGRFPGLYLVITGTPAFFDGPQGAQRLAPLAQRLHTDFTTDARFDSPRAVQLRLAGFTVEGLGDLGRRDRPGPPVAMGDPPPAAPFDLLHPAIQHHVVNSLGWRALRPLQSATIAPILAGDHLIATAPTAGGKTEAAVLPLLSRMLSEDWRGLSVLYVCPLRALLNNLHQRLERYGQLVGRRVGLWHGDIGQPERNRLLAEPPDMLLTTPESLESMLVSTRIPRERWFAHVRAVVVDEAHAFAGDDRGWHLLAVLERITRLAGREVQRIALSATLGNPDELVAWLTATCHRPARVVSPPAEAGPSSDVALDYVGSLANAALVISRLHRGEKRLVFVDSRARAEQLAVALRDHDVTTFVSHGSLGIGERRAAEQAFAEERDCVIVATSTLELGIDVGDLDRVIQIDAPPTVAAFLQRLGRTGRRPDTARQALLLATGDDALLRAAAVLLRWAEGYVEPINAYPHPIHVLM